MALNSSSSAQRKKIGVLNGILIALLLQNTAALAETRCPIQDFLALRGSDVAITTTLIAFGVDLNADGVNELFLTREEDLNGKAGNMWMVYISQGDQFRLSKQIASLRTEGIVRLKSEGSRKERLFQVSSPVKGELTILELAISASEITERRIALISGFREEDADTILDLLKGGNTETVRVKRGTRGDFKDCVLN